MRDEAMYLSACDQLAERIGKIGAPEVGRVSMSRRLEEVAALVKEHHLRVLGGGSPEWSDEAKGVLLDLLVDLQHDVRVVTEMVADEGYVCWPRVLREWARPSFESPLPSATE